VGDLSCPVVIAGVRSNDKQNIYRGANHKAGNPTRLLNVGMEASPLCRLFLPRTDRKMCGLGALHLKQMITQ